MSLPLTTPGQRDILYGDVEELIKVGFLAHTVSVGSTDVTFRSLLPGDLHMLRHRASKRGTWITWALAASVWMVGGINLLDMPHAAVRITGVMKHLPRSARGILFSITLGLFKRVHAAQKLVEAYCFEAQSRFLWGLLGHRPQGTIGIPGAERLGLNGLQSMWMAFNQVEDDRLKLESMWEAAKLVASAMSPKGISKIDQRDKQVRAEIEARRQRVMDTAFYRVKGLLTEDGEMIGQRGPALQGAHTAEELAEDMRRWVEGEEDWHDRVVSDYKRRIVERMAEQRRHHEERMEALRLSALQREEEDPGPMPLVGYTQAQMMELLRSRGHGTPGARHIYPNQDSRQRLHDRYLAQKPGEPVPMVATPEGGLSPLGAAVASRQVPYQTKSEEGQ